MELVDRHVLITGASRGVGERVAERFGAAGARLTLVARSRDRLEQTARELAATALPGDLTHAGFLASVAREAEAAGGPVDILVNNAGTDEVGAFASMSAERLERLVRLNLIAALELTRQLLPGMIARGRGHVVNVSSLAGVACVPGIAAYAATKAGLAQFTAGLRAELRGTGVGTTLVQVGVVDATAMTDSVMGYAPFARAWSRFRRLGIVADTDLDRLCATVVTAVERDRRHVRLPRRAAPLMMLPEISRRLAELLQHGLPTGVEPRSASVPQGPTPPDG